MCNTKTNVCYRPADFKKQIKVRVTGKKVVIKQRSVSGVKWINSYNEALSEAKSSKKNIFVVITAPTWCGACVYLERNVFQKSAVQNVLNNNWVALQVLDSSSDQNRFKFSGYPTMIILDPQGKELARVNGRQESAFLNEIKPYEVTGSDSTTDNVSTEIQGEAPVRFVQKSGTKEWYLTIGSGNAGNALMTFQESRRDANFVILSHEGNGKKEFIAVGLKTKTALKWNGSKWEKWFDF
jgi:hypothetical protein